MSEAPGHPPFPLVPRTFGQRSFESTIPSPSLSFSPVTRTTRLACAVFPLASVMVTVTVYIPGVVKL